MTKLIFMAGSAREQSINKKLAKIASKLAIDKGVEATFIDLKDYPMPLYDGDLENAHGLPENALKLKEIFTAHDGFFIASPEYNSSFSPLLKNTLDWMSRGPQVNDYGQNIYKGKIAALSAISGGGLGGIRGLVPLRMMLGNIGVHVIPTQAAINFAAKAFDDKGGLADENQRNLLIATVDQFIKTAKAFA